MGQRAISAILGEVWAIREDTLNGMLEIAGREHEFSGRLEALEQKLGRPLMNTETATVRDGVAIVPVTGPTFRYANLMTMLSGATSYATVATDLRAAVDDPTVNAIILQIDSPGGQTNGLNELSKQIREATAVKPVVAYVGGQAASAGYYLAAAASEIVGDELAIFGSIGAMITVEEEAAAASDGKGGKRKYKFVSSVSPMKNAAASTDEGAREIQRLADELGQLFVEAVANYRSISTEDVLANYGQGAVYTGAEALKRGMIDAVGTFESVLSRLSTGGTTTMSGAIKMSTTTKTVAVADITAAWLAENAPAVAEALRAEGVASAKAEHETAMKAAVATAKAEGAKAEQERIAGIEALSMPGLEAKITELKADATMTPERAAIEVVKAAQAGGVKKPDTTGGAAHLAGVKKTEADLKPPVAGSGEDAEPSLEDAAKAAVKMTRDAGAIA